MKGNESYSGENELGNLLSTNKELFGRRTHFGVFKNLSIFYNFNVFLLISRHNVLELGFLKSSRLGKKTCNIYDNTNNDFLTPPWHNKWAVLFAQVFPPKRLYLSPNSTNQPVTGDAPTTMNVS